MKFLGLATAAAAVALTSAPAAAEKPGDRSDQLRQTLADIVEHSHKPPGQAKRPEDPDQGDDNASDRAIHVVCTRNGPPSSERSAICPPISPQ